MDTDADYLEAELDHLAQQPGNSGSADKGWAIGHSWKVNRTVGADSVRAYTASGPSAD